MGGEPGKGNMDQWSPAQERDVFLLMFELLKKHSESLPYHDLKFVIKWAAAREKSVTASTIFTKDFWEDTGVKLWDRATKGNKVAAGLLPSWRVICKTMEKQQQLQAIANDPI